MLLAVVPDQTYPTPPAVPIPGGLGGRDWNSGEALPPRSGSRGALLVGLPSFAETKRCWGFTPSSGGVMIGAVGLVPLLIA